MTEDLQLVVTRPERIGAPGQPGAYLYKEESTPTAWGQLAGLGGSPRTLRSRLLCILVGDYPPVSGSALKRVVSLYE